MAALILMFGVEEMKNADGLRALALLERAKIEKAWLEQAKQEKILKNFFEEVRKANSVTN